MGVAVRARFPAGRRDPRSLRAWALRLRRNLRPRCVLDYVLHHSFSRRERPEPRPEREKLAPRDGLDDRADPDSRLAARPDDARDGRSGSANLPRPGRHDHRPSVVVGGEIPVRSRHRERDPHSHGKGARRSPRGLGCHPRLLGPRARAEDGRDSRAAAEHLARGGPIRELRGGVRGVLRRSSTPGCASSSSPRRRSSSPNGSVISSARAPLPNEAAATRGATTFNAMTCAECHAISGKRGKSARFAPDLTHVASRHDPGRGRARRTRRPISLRWLRNPQQIKAGCHMPDTQLTDAQVADLVAYFETLQ